MVSFKILVSENKNLLILLNQGKSKIARLQFMNLGKMSQGEGFQNFYK